MTKPLTLGDLLAEAESLERYVTAIRDPQTRDWTRDVLWINRLPSRLRERFVPMLRPLMRS
jgi:hypothetical protein